MLNFRELTDLQSSCSSWQGHYKCRNDLVNFFSRNQDNSIVMYWPLTNLKWLIVFFKKKNLKVIQSRNICITSDNILQLNFCEQNLNE